MTKILTVLLLLVPLALTQEGNPGHKEPTHVCSDKPEGDQVGCSCEQTCATPENDAKCKSYCFRKWCRCHPEGCDAAMQKEIVWPWNNYRRGWKD
jgi:hypothetical protein